MKLKGMHNRRRADSISSAVAVYEKTICREIVDRAAILSIVIELEVTDIERVEATAATRETRVL